MIDEQKKLSVIVPCYNVEGYVERCIESLVHQDIDSDAYEVLLINDGSTDRTGTICDRYATQYPQIKVIHQPNAGQAAARNTGLDHATGEYIFFVDSDDFIAEDCLKQLVNIAKANSLDVLFFEFLKVKDGSALTPKKTIEASTVKVQTFNDFFEELHYVPVGYVWQNIIRHSLIEYHRLRFSEGHLCEDTPFMYQVFFAATRISRIKDVCYFYITRSNSITHHSEQKKRYANALLSCSKLIEGLLETHHTLFSTTTHTRLLYHCNYLVYIALLESLTAGAGDDFCLQLEKDGFLPLGKLDKKEVNSIKLDILRHLSKYPKILNLVLKFTKILHLKVALD